MDRGDFLSEKIFEVLDNDTALEICGPFNNNLRYIEKSLGYGDYLQKYTV